jgi:hypothetical protein
MKYSVHMHINGKMKPLKLFHEWGRGDKGE